MNKLTIIILLSATCSCSSSTLKCIAPELLNPEQEKKVAAIIEKAKAPKVINYSTGEEEPVDYSELADPELIEDLILGGIKSYMCWKRLEEATK